MTHRPRKRAAANRRAVAALEFGLIAPVMALLIIGVYDISKITILSEQAWNASRAIAESASTLALPTTIGGPNALTWQNADLALSAMYAEIPWLANGILQGTSINGKGAPVGNFTAVLSSINYIPPTPGGCSAAVSSAGACCPSTSSYCALVVWSKAYTHPNFNATGVTRPCGSLLTQTPAGSPYSPQTLPIAAVGSQLVSAGVTVPDPFFVADVSLKYTPFFFNFITGTITLSASSYVPVRTSNPAATVTSGTSGFAVLLDDGDPDAGSAAVCPAQTAPSG